MVSHQWLLIGMLGAAQSVTLAEGLGGVPPLFFLLRQLIHKGVLYELCAEFGSTQWNNGSFLVHQVHYGNEIRWFRIPESGNSGCNLKHTYLNKLNTVGLRSVKPCRGDCAVRCWECWEYPQLKLMFWIVPRMWEDSKMMNKRKGKIFLKKVLSAITSVWPFF